MKHRLLAFLTCLFFVSLFTIPVPLAAQDQTTPFGDLETITPENAERIEQLAVIGKGKITDLAWSQAIYDSLLRLQEQAGGEDVFEIAYTENMFNVTDAAAAIRDYAADGYNIVIAHGTQYGTSLFELAPDFPETTFAYGTAVDTGKDAGLENVFAYEARAEEGG